MIGNFSFPAFHISSHLPPAAPLLVRPPIDQSHCAEHEHPDDQTRIQNLQDQDLGPGQINIRGLSNKSEIYFIMKSP